jgi:Na+/proline symporter
MGGLLIVYTVTGGARAVASTQQIQFIIIFIGMMLAGYTVMHLLPGQIGFSEALHIGGKAGKLNVITTGFTKKGFDWNDRYNLISGTIGGFFLALSYFGTDQSQVGRYLTASSEKESKLGLLMNGIIKIPMQFLILLIGVLVYVFYQFHPEPIFFNQTQIHILEKSKYADSLVLLRNQYQRNETERIGAMNGISGSDKSSLNYQRALEHLRITEQNKDQQRGTIKRWLQDKEIGGDANDTNYIFLRFVVDYLPKGLIGLLIAVIFLAAWGSIGAALNSLAAATIVDFHIRFTKKTLSSKKEYDLSRWYTLHWGIFCVIVAQLAYNIGNSLIEAVNVLGSLFYGVILGIFLVAFYAKKIRGRSVFISAIITELGVVLIHILSQRGLIHLSFLWLNAVGAAGVWVLSWLIQMIVPAKAK